MRERIAVERATGSERLRRTGRNPGDPAHAVGQDNVTRDSRGRNRHGRLRGAGGFAAIDVAIGFGVRTHHVLSRQLVVGNVRVIRGLGGAEVYSAALQAGQVCILGISVHAM